MKRLLNGISHDIRELVNDTLRWLVVQTLPRYTFDDTVDRWWHIHHELLVEHSWGQIDGRVRQIKRYKPVGEIRRRLKWMTPVKDIEAYRAIQSRFEQRMTAELDPIYVRIRETPIGTDEDAISAMWDEYHKANARNYNEREAALLALHAREHPGCPWRDGTLFPEKKIAGIRGY